MQEKIRVAVAGGLGRMGQETVKTVLAEDDMELVGIADVRGEGRQLYSYHVYPDLKQMLKECRPQVIVDFTVPSAVMENTLTAMEQGVIPVVGTTGLTDADLVTLEREADKKGIGVAVIPNFAIGAVLMMKMAKEAAKYLPQVEIIELHHDQKIDVPSGTAIKTAHLISQARTNNLTPCPDENVKITGCRGGEIDGIHIHSVRLPGLVAHQEVLFGGKGQLLTIRHDSFNRESFMPGVLVAIRAMIGKKGLIYGLENLI